LCVLVIWFVMFPKDDPNMQAKTTMVESLGRRSKNMIKVTTLGPPPPSPARVDNPAIKPKRIAPKKCSKVKIYPFSVIYYNNSV